MRTGPDDEPQSDPDTQDETVDPAILIDLERPVEPGDPDGQPA